MITRKATSEEIFQSIMKFAKAFNEFEADTDASQETENKEVKEELGKSDIVKENSMDELNTTACGDTPVAAEEETAVKASLESEAAKEEKPESENPFAKSDKKEDKEEEDTAEGKGEGEDKKDEKDEKKKEIVEKDYKEAEKLLNNVLSHEIEEKGMGEEGEEGDVADLKKAIGLLGMKVEEKKEEPIPGGDVLPEESALPEVGAEGLGDEPADEPADKPADKMNPFTASLVASFEKKATIADSIWHVRTADNADYLTFAVKAAFGNNIDNDATRSSYATSEEFGKAVVASLLKNKVASQTAAAAAVLSVVAHYTPSHEGVKKFVDNKESTHAKASGEGDTLTDKNLVGAKEVKASVEAPITKKAEAESCASDTFLPGADSRSEKEGNNQDKSVTPHATATIPTETDKKVIASYEERLKKAAEEIQSLKLEAAIKEKSAKVQEAVSMMVRAGLIKANEQVRVAALKDGLSIEAANAKAMAASIDAQSKNLFGMNTPQLESYMQSLASLSPRTQVVASKNNDALTVKASFAETEVERLSKLLGWE